MKKIYFSFSMLLLVFNSGMAQLSLTQVNEPVVGDVLTMLWHDSTTAVPKATGASQNWDFTSLTTGTLTETSTYTTVASTPSPSAFPDATLAEDKGNGEYTLLKMTSTGYEVQGLMFPGLALNFSNTAVFATWPINFGYDATDQFAGSAVSGSVTTEITGTVNINGAGNGTVVMPGGFPLTNCLQLVTSVTLNITQGTSTQTIVQQEYNYYHASSKFPVLMVRYEAETSGTVTTNSFKAKVNTSVVAGINSEKISTDFKISPNPASDVLSVSVNNNSNDEVCASIINALGKTVQKECLGTDKQIETKIDISRFPKGIYFLKLSSDKSQTIKKFVIN